MGEGRSPVILLNEMIEEIEFLAMASQGRDVEDLVDDPTLKRAFERALAILGEAAKQMPEEVKARNPDIPWREMARMRDLLNHAYHRVDIKLLWRAGAEAAVPLRGRLLDIRDESISS